MSRPPSSGPTHAYASDRMSALREARSSRKAQRQSDQEGRDRSQTIQKSSGLAKIGKSLSAQKRKALLASGAVATLMVAVVLPDQVSSEAIAQSNCLEVIQSGAEMSRGEISALIKLPTGSPKQVVRQAVAEPYCTLPVGSDSEETGDETAQASLEGTETSGAETVSAEREAYPLAFDPEVWIVLNYESGKYTSYDFVFKP